MIRNGVCWATQQMTCGCWTCLSHLNEWETHHPWLLALIPRLSVPDQSRNRGKLAEERGLLFDSGGGGWGLWSCTAVRALTYQSMSIAHTEVLTNLQTQIEVQIIVKCEHSAATKSSRMNMSLSEAVIFDPEVRVKDPSPSHASTCRNPCVNILHCRTLPHYRWCWPVLLHSGLHGNSRHN